MDKYIPYNGNNPQKKMFANCQLFLIHKKTFVNDDNPSRIHSFLVQLPILPFAMPSFPTKVATVKHTPDLRWCNVFYIALHACDLHVIVHVFIIMQMA